MTERRRNRFTFAPKKLACASPKGTTRYLTPSEAPYIQGRYTLGDKLQQHVASARRSDKSLYVYWKIFVKIFVSATELILSQQHVAKNQIRQNLCDLCTWSDLSARRVAATCRLVCTDLKTKLEARLGRWKRETRGGGWEGEERILPFPSSYRPPRACYFSIVAIFDWDIYRTGSSAEERGHI